MHEHLSAQPSPFVQLRLSGDPVLRRPAAQVPADRLPLDSLVERMLGVMALNSGVGLAAPQIGVSLSVFVADLDGTVVAVANPTLEPAGDIYDHTEGCLSLPGKTFVVPRHRTVVLCGIDALTMASIRLELTGFAAAVAQHEVDHLAGMLIADRR